MRREIGNLTQKANAGHGGAFRVVAPGCGGWVIGQAAPQNRQAKPQRSECQGRAIAARGPGLSSPTLWLANAGRGDAIPTGAEASVFKGRRIAVRRNNLFASLSRSRPTTDRPDRFVPLRLTLILLAIAPSLVPAHPLKPPALGLRLSTTGIDHGHEWLR